MKNHNINHPITSGICRLTTVNGAYARDIMAAMLVYQNNETAAMLVYQTMKQLSCSKPVLWELIAFLMETLSFASLNLHSCW